MPSQEADDVVRLRLLGFRRSKEGVSFFERERLLRCNGQPPIRVKPVAVILRIARRDDASGGGEGDAEWEQRMHASR